MNNFGFDPQVQASLLARNSKIASFWLTDPEDRMQFDAALVGRKVLVVDAEDCFTVMLTHQLTAIGLQAERCRFNDDAFLDPKWDLIVMGPGPGDPRDAEDPRIANLRYRLVHLLKRKKPFIAVCLSHQILCLELGLELIKRASPNQGVQREIELFGTEELVGFYNTFVAKCERAAFFHGQDICVEVCRDPHSQEVHALRSDFFVSIQFHAESFLTQRGIKIIGSSVKRVLGL